MTLHVDLPGVDPKTITLEVGGSQVVVSGTNAGKTFTNKYTLSDEFEVSTAFAAWRHGRLDIRILRSGRPEFKKIPIEINSGY
jgi:HSP20 family molecular chaperone IbpA